jgi:hypothetical protein
VAAPVCLESIVRTGASGAVTSMEDPSKSRARSPRRTDRSPSVTSGSVSNSAAAACPVSCTTRPFPIPNRLKPAIINCLLHYCLARGFLLSQCCCPGSAHSWGRCCCRGSREDRFGFFISGASSLLPTGDQAKAGRGMLAPSSL